MRSCHGDTSDLDTENDRWADERDERPPYHIAAQLARDRRTAEGMALAACLGPGEDVTPLDWLSALLSDLGESGYPSTTEDPEAAWDALTHCGRLLDGLRAAVGKAKGNE